MTAKLIEMQAAILDAVGPRNWRDMGIVDATLRLPAGKHPTLELHLQARPGRFNAEPLANLRQLYVLRPIDAPPTPEEK